MDAKMPPKEPDQVKLVLIVDIEWDLPLYTASIYIFVDFMKLVGNKIEYSDVLYKY
jgi:hypothetical protein